MGADLNNTNLQEINIDCELRVPPRSFFEKNAPGGLAAFHFLYYNDSNLWKLPNSL